MESWNPNYTYAERSVDVGPLTGTLPEMAAAVVQRLSLDPALVRGQFQETETSLRVYLDGEQDVRIDIATGHGSIKQITRRKVFFEVNALHLNNLKGLWTYVADAFAIALIVLALTGMTMMKGDRGFFGRGKYFVGAGLIIPIAAVVYMYS
jgi:hypothetical protein